MQRTMIVVLGPPKVGKSWTIRRAFDELRRVHKCIDPGSGRGDKDVRGGVLEIDGEKVGFNSPGDVPGDLERDLNRLIGSEKVGFNSPGDVPGHLERDLKRLIRINCSIIVCAARKRRDGRSSKTFQIAQQCAAQAEPPFKIVRIEKQANADHTAGNLQKVEEIKAAVRTAIAEAQLVEA
jgi:hypothetical protein